jgi:hypothetical protein
MLTYRLRVAEAQVNLDFLAQEAQINLLTYADVC